MAVVSDYSTLGIPTINKKSTINPTPVEYSGLNS